MRKLIQRILFMILLMMSHVKEVHAYEYKTINKTGQGLTVTYEMQGIKGPKKPRTKTTIPPGASQIYTSHGGWLQGVDFVLENGVQKYHEFSWGPIPHFGGATFTVTYDSKRNKIKVDWEPKS